MLMPLGAVTAACLAIALGSLPGAMGNARLVADVAKGTLGAAVDSVVAHDNTIFFAAQPDPDVRNVIIYSLASGQASPAIAVLLENTALRPSDLYPCSFKDKLVFQSDAGSGNYNQLGFMQNGTTTPGLFATIGSS